MTFVFLTQADFRLRPVGGTAALYLTLCFNGPGKGYDNWYSLIFHCRQDNVCATDYSTL